MNAAEQYVGGELVETDADTAEMWTTAGWVEPVTATKKPASRRKGAKENVLGYGGPCRQRETAADRDHDRRATSRIRRGGPTAEPIIPRGG